MAWVNGQLSTLDSAKVPLNDRAVAFGDGVYEVLIGYGRRLWAVERHFQRLARSLREMAIRGVDLQALRSVIDRVVEAAEPDNPMVYLQISRGIAPRSHDYDPAMLDPSILVTVREAPFPTAEARAHGVACITHADLRWKRCDIKSLNLLGNVIARQQAKQKNAVEAILVNDTGVVTEGSHTGVSTVTDGVVRAHPEGPAILPSITRQLTYEHAAALGIEVVRETIGVDELFHADEVFLSGTTAEVLPVTQIDGRRIGNGRPGPVSQRLQAAYRAAVEAEADAP